MRKKRAAQNLFILVHFLRSNHIGAILFVADLFVHIFSAQTNV